VYIYPLHFVENIVLFSYISMMTYISEDEWKRGLNGGEDSMLISPILPDFFFYKKVF
jgi:hypothetical protein